MGHKYAEIAFTPSVKAVQESSGSRCSYAKMETREDKNRFLTPREADFIAARDSFYMATTSETGWPYLQHRGGPPGFISILDKQTIGFADFRGNRQYISVGNLQKDDRVSLFFMDYPNKARLKLFGRAQFIGPDDPSTLATLELPAYSARVERGVLIKVTAFDWNCPQHITQRFTAEDIEKATVPLHARIAELEAQLEQSTASETEETTESTTDLSWET